MLKASSLSHATFGVGRCDELARGAVQRINRYVGGLTVDYYVGAPFLELLAQHVGMSFRDPSRIHAGYVVEGPMGSTVMASNT